MNALVSMTRKDFASQETFTHGSKVLVIGKPFRPIYDQKSVHIRAFAVFEAKAPNCEMELNFSSYILHVYQNMFYKHTFAGKRIK